MSVILPLYPRPRTRGDCVDAPRPCPFVSCRHNLYLSISRKKTVRLAFPGLEPDEMRESCSLDVAERGEHSLYDIAEIMGMTHEGASLILSDAITKLKRERRSKLLIG